MTRTACTLLISTLALSTSGCILAAAGAGAGSGIYLTSRGVESVIPASIGRVADATERAFTGLEIERTGLEVDDRDNRRIYRGQSAGGGRDVVVTLEAEESGSTKVEVTARSGVVTWDKDLARRIVERIAQESATS